MFSLLLLFLRLFNWRRRRTTPKAAMYPPMPDTMDFQSPPIDEGKTALRWARITALFMIVLLSAGLAVTALFIQKHVHDVQLSTPWMTVWENHGAYAVLLAIFSSTVVVWIMIFIWMNAYWPGGFIFERRMKKMMVGGGGMGVGLSEQPYGGQEQTDPFASGEMAGDPFAMEEPAPVHKMRRTMRG